MNAQPQTVLVTGGAGFIGSHLVAALVARGAAVTVVDNLCNGSLANLGPLVDAVEFYPLDIRGPVFRDLLVSKPFDAVCHFAANAYVPPSVEDPKYDFHVNLLAPFEFLEVLRRSGLRPRCVVASSAAVYGNPVRVPISETDPTVPISPYGVSKLATERYVAVYCQLYGLQAACLRLFSAYGPRQRKQIVYDFIEKLTRNPHALEILGDGTQVRDLVFVEDVVAAALLLLDSAPLTGEVYNVATGAGHTTREVAEVVSRAMGLTPEFVFTQQIRPGDTERWVADIERIRALGFAPRFSFDEGVRRTVEWYRMGHNLPVPAGDVSLQAEQKGR